MKFSPFFIHLKKPGIYCYASVLLLAAVLLLTSCAREHIYLPTVDDYDRNVTAKNRYNLRLGVVVGPYGEMFTETIMPQFSKKGYTVELVEYTSYLEPNLALANRELDMNMFQHYNYLNNFKFQNDINLSAIAEIPTASMGLYSKEYDSADEIEEGAIVAIPNDVTNRARAISFLDSVNLISVDPFVNNKELGVDDIIENYKGLIFVAGDASELVGSLDNYELAVINGNYAINAGLDLSDALYNETLSDNYVNVIAVRTEDLDEQFVQDILDIVYSREYTELVLDPDGKYQNFQLPRRLMARKGGAANK